MLGNWSHGSVATISLCYRYKKRRLALRSAAPRKCLRAALLNGKENEGKKKENEALFTPHIDICMVPRLYPDTINPAFHLGLALKMAPHYLHWEKSPLALVRHWWTRQEWQQAFSFLLSKIFEGFLFGRSAPIHRCQNSSLFLLLFTPVVEKDQYKVNHRGKYWPEILRKTLRDRKRKGMSRSVNVLRHVSLDFRCWASDSHQKLPLRVCSCFIRIILEKRAFDKNAAFVQRTWTIRTCVRGRRQVWQVCTSYPVLGLGYTSFFDNKSAISE